MQKMKKTIEGGGTDLFVCFTSRPSAASTANSASASASMRIPSSKFLMSPSRNSSNPSIPSLSSSLSRRLRSSGSIKGGQSPMFPAAGVAVGRKKGVAFEAAEPSSPKVTCIGQVRVKSKKKKKQQQQAKNLVTRTRSGREASFRRNETATGGRKAVSFCDALRAFGSEMNCFAPCGWSPCSSSRGEEEGRKKVKRSSSSSSCGAAIARWLMAIEEDGEEKGRELVGLVVEDGRKEEIGLFVREKKVELEFDDVFEKKEEVFFIEKAEMMAEEEEGRVSVCIPPKNALLLMRCRSDPVRMASLANRFWDSPAMMVECEEEVEEEDEELREFANVNMEKVVDKKIDNKGTVENETLVEQVSAEVEEVEKEVVVDEEKLEEAFEEEKATVAVESKVEEAKEATSAAAAGGEILAEVISARTPEMVEKEEGVFVNDESREEEVNEEETIYMRTGADDREEVEIILRRSISCSVPKSNDFSKVREGGKRRSFSYKEKKERRRHSFSTEREARRHSFCSEKEARKSSLSVDKEGRRRWSFSVEKENLGDRKGKPVVQSVEPTMEEEMPAAGEEPAKAAKEANNVINEKSQAIAASAADEVREQIEVSRREETPWTETEKKSTRELPECLLLMMYEPKLSMEVSKETWVCSTDFLRWRPNCSQQCKQQTKVIANADNADSNGGKVEEEKLSEDSDNAIQVTTEKEAIVPETPPKPPPMEQKILKTSAAIGPSPQNFVLTRCKSEPPKSSARLAPDACFWKARHQPIGTAGLGF